jgi:hypothetical protein
VLPEGGAHRGVLTPEVRPKRWKQCKNGRNNDTVITASVARDRSGDAVAVNISTSARKTVGYSRCPYVDGGEKIFVEVKTTRGSIDSDFFISASELAFARTHSPQYRLYRFYDYSDDLESAKFYVLSGALDGHEQLCLAPTNFKVSMRCADSM